VPRRRREFRWVTQAQCADLPLAPGYAGPIGQFWAALK
jgi:hypothetical protein